MAAIAFPRFAAPVNIGTTERIATTIGGAALILNAVARRSPWSIALAVGGAVAVARGVSGHCALYGRLDSANHVGRDIVDDSSDASFPASDPPSWTPVSAAGHPTGC